MDSSDDNSITNEDEDLKELEDVEDVSGSQVQLEDAKEDIAVTFKDLVSLMFLKHRLVSASFVEKRCFGLAFCKV